MNLAHAISALFWGSLVLWLTGCASQYRKPCTVNIAFTLDEDDAVNEYCRAQVKKLDDGTTPTPDTRFRGCANLSRASIRTREDQATWGHEVKHVLDYYCGRN